MAAPEEPVKPIAKLLRISTILEHRDFFASPKGRAEIPTGIDRPPNDRLGSGHSPVFRSRPQVRRLHVRSRS
jgi:hypothetical protein